MEINYDMKEKYNALYLYLDDIRDAPTRRMQKFRYGYVVNNVNDAKGCVIETINLGITEIWFDLDHDLGDYASQGGDAIEFVNWLIEEYHNKDVNFKFHFHSMNPVGVQNMRNAIAKYWEEF